MFWPIHLSHGLISLRKDAGVTGLDHGAYHQVQISFGLVLKMLVWQALIMELINMSNSHLVFSLRKRCWRIVPEEKMLVWQALIMELITMPNFHLVLSLKRRCWCDRPWSLSWSTCPTLIWSYPFKEDAGVTGHDHRTDQHIKLSFGLVP